MTRVWRIILLASLTILISAGMQSCNDVPQGVIPQEQMAALLADLHKGEAVVDANSQTMSGDSVRRAFRQAIYAKHGYTTAQVDSSMRWYGFHMDKYVEVYDRTLEILEAELQKAQEASGASATATTNGYMAMEGDSVDVWSGVRTRRFASNMPSDIISFNILSEPNWEAGDIYTLRAKMLNNQNNAYVSIGIDYTDGNHEYLSSKMIGDGWQEIAFAVDSARTPREIYGTIYYPTSDSRVAFIDSISLTRTRWKPAKRYVRDDVRQFSNHPISNRPVGAKNIGAKKTETISLDNPSISPLPADINRTLHRDELQVAEPISAGSRIHQAPPRPRRPVKR